jgi:hypothetical protein
MTAKKKEILGKSSFKDGEESQLKATALSAIESALMPHSPQEEDDIAHDSHQAMGSIPIALHRVIEGETGTDSLKPACIYGDESSLPQLSSPLIEGENHLFHISSTNLSSKTQTSPHDETFMVLPKFTQKTYPYWVALIVSCAWLFVSGMSLLAYKSPSHEGFLFFILSSTYLNIDMLEHVSWIIIPPLFFLLSALFYSRSQQVKHTTHLMQIMAERLTQPEHLAQESISTLSQAVRREVSAIGDGVERALARIAEFEAIIRTEINMFEKAYADGEQRIHSLINKLALQKEEVLLSTEDLRSSVGDLHQSLFQDLDDARHSLVNALAEHIGSARKTLQSTAEDAASMMSAQVEETSNQLKNMSEMLFVSLGVRCADINQQLAETAQRVETELLAQTTKVSDGLSDKSLEVSHIMNDKAEALKETWNEASQKIFSTLEEGFDVARIALEKVAEKTVSALDEKTNDLCITLAEHTQQSQDALVSTGKDVVSTMATQTTRIHESLAIYVDSLATVLRDQGLELNTAIADKLTALKGFLDTDATEIVQKLGGHLSTLDQTFHIQGGELDTRLSEHLTRFEKTITHDGTQLVSRVEDVTSNFSAHVNASIGQATELFSDHGEKVMRIFESKIRVIGEMLAHHFATFESGSEGQVNAFVRSIETLFQRMYEDLNKHFAQSSQTIQDDISAKATTLSEVFTTHEHKLSQALGEKTEHFELASSEAHAHLQQTLDAASSAIERSLRYRGVEIAEAVSDGTKHFEEALSSQLVAFNTSVSERYSGIECAFNAFLGAFGKQSESVAKEIVHIGEAIVHTLESRAASVSDILRECSESLSSLMIRSAESLQESIDVMATRSVAQLVSANQTIQDDITHVSQTLSEASSMLRSLAVETRRDLMDVEKALAEQASSVSAMFNDLAQETHTSYEDLRTKVEELKSATHEALDETDVLVTKLDNQGRSIAAFSQEHTESLCESVRHLEDVGITLTQTLSARKDSLESALSGVLERTESITSVTASLDTDLRRHCTTMETTLNHVSEVLTHGARNAIDSLKKHYDLLYSLAMEGSTQSNQDLAHMREQITSDINGIISQSLEKFHSVSRTIHDIASSIRKDLESTHQQLQHSLLELPETSEQTSIAMRRVIGDQIKALDALNLLVKKASAGDSGPGLSESDHEILSNLSQPKDPAPVPKSSGQPFTPSIPPLKSTFSRESSTAYPPVRKKPTPSAPVSPPTGVDTGWLSPLLERASGKEPSPVPQKVQHSSPPTPPVKQDSSSEKRPLRSHLALLNTLARDIPKIVDAQRIDEAWARYARGEPGAFTDALYTPHGQHIFKDVARRYQESHDFRQTVSHYMDEFESLLNSSGTDVSSPTRRAYLTSDTGKVYTFLAHLSGRL